MSKISYLLITFVILLSGIAVYLSRLTSNSVPAVAVQPTIEITPTPYYLDEKLLFESVNKWRIRKGFKSYIEHETLCLIAAYRLTDIQTDWSHNNFVPTVDRIMGNQTRYIAENLANNRFSEEGTVTAWQNSPSHRENLDANYKYSCIKTYKQFAVQIFGNF